MEKLAITCKILYDKDYLDEKKYLQEHYNFTKVLYKSEEEYYELQREFLDNIYQYDFKSHLENEIKDFINKNLYKLSKNKSKEWCNITTNIIYIAIKNLKNCYGMVITTFNTNCSDMITEILFDSEYINQIIQYNCPICNKYTNKLIHPEFCIQNRCKNCADNKPVDLIDDLKRYISINQSDEKIKDELDHLGLNYSNLISLKV